MAPEYRGFAEGNVSVFFSYVMQTYARLVSEGKVHVDEAVWDDAELRGSACAGLDSACCLSCVGEQPTACTVYRAQH